MKKLNEDFDKYVILFEKLRHLKPDVGSDRKMLESGMDKDEIRYMKIVNGKSLLEEFPFHPIVKWFNEHDGDISNFNKTVLELNSEGGRLIDAVEKEYSRFQYQTFFEQMRMYGNFEEEYLEAIAETDSVKSAQDMKVTKAKEWLKKYPSRDLVKWFFENDGDVSGFKDSLKCRTGEIGKIMELEKPEAAIFVPNNTRNFNVGESDYSKHKIQPWDIWIEYKLNPWDADIVKRILRTKKTDSRRLDYEKIIHICQERIRQIDAGIEI